MVDASELTESDLGELTAQLESLTTTIANQASASRGSWWERGPDYRAAFDADSPFRGSENPWSPSMTVQRTGPAGVGGGSCGDVTLNRRWAGPPNAVHGGVLAGLFDEIIGDAAAHAEPNAFAVTGRLAIRYRNITPIGVPLRIEAEVVALSSRSLKLHATCTADEKVTATADALMVVRGRRRQTERL